MNNPIDIIKIIHDIERENNVERWRCNDVCMWPLIRIKLYYSLTQVSINKNRVEKNKYWAIKKRVFQFFRIINGLIKYIKSSILDVSMNLKPKEARVLFLSDGVSYAKIAGKWYEKYCDPIIKYLNIKNISTFLISPSHQYYTPRRTQSFFVQPRIDFIKVKATLGLIFKNKIKVELFGFDAAMNKLKARNLGIEIPSTSSVVKDSAMLFDIASYYEALIREINPSLAVIVSFYSLEGMSFILACHRLGIPSLDIQHGVAGNLNAAYGQWTRVSVDGYKLLPTLFWCWTVDDFDALRPLSIDTNNNHIALLGGNPWLGTWLKGEEEFVFFYDEKVNRIKEKFTAKTHILVTLQYGISKEEELGELFDAMKEAPSNWMWWIRLHPSMLDVSNNVSILLKKHMINNAEINMATKIPLYAWLRNVDIHITHSSSTIFEATEYNIPTVIINKFGADLFEKHIDLGWAVLAESSSDIVSKINMQLNKTWNCNTRKPPTSSVDKDGVSTIISLVH